MGFLFDNCTISAYTGDMLQECEAFSCGDDDLDDFFSSKAFEYAEFRMGKSFCFRLRNDLKKMLPSSHFHTTALGFTTYHEAAAMPC